MGTARAPRGIIPAPRGKRGVLLRALSGPGFIPAHAGKTSQSSAHRACPRVHPRSRGENGSLFLHRHMVLGSSPLTRGKRDFARDELGCVGLIPAHAGKTSSSHCTKTTRQAHPRSRRENVVLAEGVGPAMGSSPLTQGKRVSLRHVPVTTGLIPAHAGKTRSWLARSGRSWAHPRSREGKLKQNSYRIHDVRFIPAHAGKTNRPSRRSRCHRAHPHSRGENSGDTAKSSPT